MYIDIFLDCIKIIIRNHKQGQGQYLWRDWFLIRPCPNRGKNLFVHQSLSHFFPGIFQNKGLKVSMCNKEICYVVAFTVCPRSSSVCFVYLIFVFRLFRRFPY